MQNIKYKFGLVGCGRVSENHLSALTSGNIPAELVAICDIDPQKVKAKSENTKSPATPIITR
jgi:UDP-N-acetyl-2-amino-2-deoxyglucuronate dehydrogenase